MATKTNILVTGATGYIGGSVLARFLERKDAASLGITALVRSSEKADKLTTLGINAVVGSHSDCSLMEKLASEADVVLSMADANNLEAAQATLKGLKARHGKTGKAPIFIHTAGTIIVADDAAGMHTTDTVYDDADPDQIETLAPTQLLHNVDLELVNADKAGYVKTYIVLPGLIYGIATGKLVELGIQNPYSALIPLLISSSVDRGEGGMVGTGKNIWPNVHIDDVADLYLVLYDSIQTNPDTGHGREGFYFGENGEYKFYDLAKAIAQALVDLGRIRSTEPTNFTKEEIDKYFGGSNFLGSNSRCKANRSRSIGWKPVKTTQDMLASIKPQTEASIKKNNL